MQASVQDSISHVKSCSETGELIFTLQKACLSRQNLNDNMDKLQKMPLNMANTNGL